MTDRLVRRHRSTLSQVIAFVTIAIAVSWLVWFPLVRSRLGAGPPASAYLHLVGSLGPAIAALLVAAATGTLQSLVTRMKRMPRQWLPWTIAIGGPAALLAIGILADLASGSPAQSARAFIRVAEYPALGPAGIIAAEIVFYGFGEEIGWRGFLLPRLARRLGTFTAATLVAIPWAVWHVPLLITIDSYISLDPLMLGGWAISLLGGSYITAWLLDAARDSIAPVAVFHGLLDIAMVNAGVGPAALTAMGAALSLCGLVAGVALWARGRSEFSPDLSTHSQGSGSR